MKKMKWLNTGLALLLIVAMLAGCGAAGSKVPETKPVATVAADTLASDPDVFPITQEKYEMRVMAMQDPTVEDIETNEFTVEYEDKTNIHINWEMVPSKSASEKLNLVLGTAEDLPDVILGMDISNEQVMSYGVDQGLLIDLTPYIEKYAPHVQEMLDYNPLIRQSVTAPDGGIYALPNFEDTLHVHHPQKAWIYKPWLDKLGLEVPTNIEELEAVLTAFRDKDPNGNGKPDEIPMTGAITGWMQIPVDYLMSAFIYTLQSNRFVVDDEGNVSVPYNTPEWREGLTYINHLCEEGLLDPQSLVQDTNQLKKTVMIEGDNVVGCITSGAPTGFISTEHERRSDWISLPPLAGVHGKTVTGTQSMEVKLGKFAITSACKDPAVAIRWVDWFYSLEGGMRATCGVEGRDWRWANEDEIGLNGKPGVYVKMLYFGTTQNAHWSKMAPNFKPTEVRNGLVDPRPDGEQYLYDITQKQYVPYAVKNTMRHVYFDPEDVETVTESKYLIEEYVPEAYSKFIIGEWDIEDDKQWQSYLDNLESMGLSELVSLYDEAYKAQYVN